MPVAPPAAHLADWLGGWPASARVARASGFPDTGWRVLGFWERSP